ncbi:MAG: dissimilatory sulfite reductase D family protein [Desulforegulaceae bacterium]|jgi:hypothetical protein|nr:dissimilatory sulfite reductase D family protein [Desulforegulaceae bacterium]
MALPDNAKEMIVEELTKKSKTKSKFYFNDLSKMFPDESPRAVKKLVNEMVNDGVLEYWSSGSTTMYGLKGMGELG